MGLRESVIALVLGALQGIFEWLPISSEGNLTIAITAIGGDPTLAVQLSLFLHLGTALAATAYYRGEIADLALELPRWRPREPFGPDRAEVTFLAIATVVSGVVAVGAYVALVEAVTALGGGAFVVLIGVLLVAVGAFQRFADEPAADRRRDPGLLDALLVGVGQGLAVLPGVSRSGTTVGLLLLREHDGESAFRLSFLLSVPAALGAGLLAVVDAGGLPGVTPTNAVLAIGASAVVGYLTIDALLRLVRRVRFWAVCLGLGALAIAGGAVVWIG